jgi:hypothetical protein
MDSQLKIPIWVQDVLSRFENGTTPFQEVEIVDALGGARKAQGDLNDEDFRGYVAEWSAFLFGERRGKDSAWGTYFAPFMSAKNSDGSDFYSPDIKELSSDIVVHWEERAKSCRNPVMRARYSDLVWDLKRRITGEKPGFEFVGIAIDSYLDATDQKFYPMEVVGIRWLGRALDLAQSINDQARIKRIVDFMFEFYGRVAQAKFVGTWLFLYDELYGKKFVTDEQETRIVSTLETMLQKTADNTRSSDGVYHNLDPWGAEAAASRLAEHYHRKNDKANVDRVIKAYGQAFEHMASEASPMMASAWLQPVAERYEEEGLKSDAERVRVAASEQARNVVSGLKTISASVEVKQDELEKLIDQLIGSGDSNLSLARIAEYFIPRAESARQLVERLRTDAPFLSMIPITVVDRDGSATARIGSLDEDAEGHLHRQLGQAVDFYQPFLEHALAKFNERYRLSVDELLAFLCESPLYAKNRTELLREGLRAYTEGDYVKAVHVLVPQIEYTLRYFVGLLGLPTRKAVRNHPGITDAKNMNDILSDARVQEKLTENLWRYLAVVYIDRRGLNLRNNLCHGLAGHGEFNRHIANRVFHTLLAISLMRSPK